MDANMKTKAIALFAIVLALSFALAGCGGGGSTTGAANAAGATGANAGAATQQAQGYIGWWELVSAEHDGEKFISEENLKTLRSLGYDVNAFVTEEGELYWSLATTTYYCKIDKEKAAEGDDMTVVMENHYNSVERYMDDLSVEGDTFVIDSSGYIYTFQRADSAQSVITGDIQDTWDNYLSDDWIVNGKAVIELSGEELYWLLWANDYYWDEGGNADVRNEPYGTAVISLLGPGGTYLSENEMRALNAGGRGSQVIYVMQCTEFSSAEGALATCFNGAVTDYVSAGDKLVATIADFAGNDYLIFVMGGKSGYSVMVMSADGLSVMEELLGGELGSSVSEAYANLAQALS